MELKEIPVDREYKYKGRIVNMRVDMARLPNGQIKPREVVEHPGGVTVAAITENNELVFVKQFRYPHQLIMIELPAGKLEVGENPFAAGVRELEEETGAKAEKYYDLGKFYPTPGYSAETIYLYAAKGLEFVEQHLDEDEFVNVEIIKIDDAVNMVLKGEICDGKTQALILKLKNLIRTNRLDNVEIENWREKL